MTSHHYYGNLFSFLYSRRKIKEAATGSVLTNFAKINRKISVPKSLF